MRSNLERTLAGILTKHKVKFTYETLKIPYTIKHTYNPDFMLSNGIILEAKGFFRPGDVAKMRAVKSANPDLDIRFVFQEPHRKIPGQKQTHAQWAERHGFPWAGINDVPLDWINND